MGLITPFIVTPEELNSHFSSISSDSSALSVGDFFENREDKDFFSHFSFSEVILREVKLAMKQSSSQARGYDNVS